MQRIAIVLLLAGMLLELPGCKSAPPAPTSEPETVVITFLAYEWTRKDYAALITEFEAQYPNIEVQFIAMEDVLDGQEYDLRLMASAADTLWLGASPLLAHDAYFRDLTSLIEADPTFDAADFWPGLLASFQRDGYTVGLPTAVVMELIFFDSAAFDAAGLPRPAPGWTWEDFQQAARALTLREAGQTTRYGFAPAPGLGAPISLLAPVMEAAVVQAGGALDPVALTGLLGWYVDLADEGAMPVLQEDTSAWQQINPLIEGGQAAMWVESMNNLESRRETVGPAVMTAPFPVSELTSTTSPGRSPCVVMSAGTAHPRQAWAWLHFLTYHPVLMGGSPARPSVAESDGYWDDVSAENQQALRFALEHAWYGNSSPYYDALHAINRAMLQAMAGEMDLTAALELNSDFAVTREAPPARETPVAVATPRPTASEASVTVDYFAISLLHPDLTSVKTLAEEFNREHPNVEVRPSDPLAWDGGGNMADLAQQYDCLASLGDASPEALEHFYSLDPFLARDAQLLDDLDPALLDALRVDGQLYALPVSSLPTLIYYNADYLELLDLAPPAPDWTAADLLALARAATSGQGSDKTYGFAIGRGPHQFSIWCAGRSLV